MLNPPATSRPPRLHGLNPAALAGVLSGTAGGPPGIPEWEIGEPLGEGGLGTVWKARRTSDGLIAAVKVPRSEDISLVERLEVEAAALRALDHPHIVRLLESGPLDDGSLYLAMEYVDGPPLSQAIPATGFAATRAYEIFRQVASAVVHAHSRGVLHRDLKPGNILLDASGKARVADFGLAHSVPDRVQRLSLTLTGLVAGTAEYLPPEAYRSGYEPAAAADIYALGVILYEMLAGHPPRGAWQAVSLQKKDVDVRVDDVLRRALEPDPDKRFPTVQAMLDELERILRSPARFAGTPRVTSAVRFIDFAWTALGVFSFLGALGIWVRVEKYGLKLPVDLIGTETMRIGTYQAVFVLLVAAALMGLWQLVRLWRFRRVPLRESLPSPFGLRLGSSRIAAAAVFLAQVMLVLLPTVLAAQAWRSQCSYWLQEGDAPWTQGLVVTAGYRGMVAHDPWAWPEPDKEYSLRERSGWITDPLSKQFDHTDFIPGLIPRVLAGLAVFHAAAIVLTILSAIFSWWIFRKWGHAVALAGLLIVAFRAVKAEAAYYHADLKWENESMQVNAWTLDLHVRQAMDVIRWLMSENIEPAWESMPPEKLAYYAASVQFDESAPRSGPAIPEYLESLIRESRASRRSVEFIKRDIGPVEGSYSNLRYFSPHYYLDFTDPPDGLSTGGLTALVFHGNVFPGKGADITKQNFYTLSLWAVERRPLPADEANAWVKAFLAALLPDKDPAALADLFYAQFLQFDGAAPPVVACSRDIITGPLRNAVARGSRPRLASQLAPAESLPGGRQRITIQIEDRGQPATWTADLISTGGGWKCVKLLLGE